MFVAKDIKKIKIGSFTETVLQIVREIEKGKVLTYKEVAILAGIIGASRAVGTIMKNNYDNAVPCYRVIRSDGNIGDYNRGGREKKIELLKSEGVSIVNNKIKLRK